jgi:hypothetical protein
MEADKASVLLGVPGNNICFGTVAGIVGATTRGVNITLENSRGSWDNFNTLLADGLNDVRSGDPQKSQRYFGMLHADIAPSQGWVDVLLDVLRETGALLVSVAVPIKDKRGVCSCGIGDPTDPWGPYRRLTMHELMKGNLSGQNETFGETFDAASLGYPGWPLLHNNGCWLANLNHWAFHERDANNTLKAFFNFPKRVYFDTEVERFKVAGLSEDWWFSMRLHELGVKSVITRKVCVIHEDGAMAYPNNIAWGAYLNGDEDTAQKWRKKEPGNESTGNDSKEQPGQGGLAAPVGADAVLAGEQREDIAAEADCGRAYQDVSGAGGGLFPGCGSITAGGWDAGICEHGRGREPAGVTAA